MTTWYNGDVVKLSVSLDDADVVKLLNLKAVSLYVSLFLNTHQSLSPSLFLSAAPSPRSFQLTIHTRANAYRKRPARPRNCISFSLSLSWKWVSTSPAQNYFWYSLCGSITAIAERIRRWAQNIHETDVHTRILVASLCASLIDLGYHSCTTFTHSSSLSSFTSF